MKFIYLKWGKEPLNSRPNIKIWYKDPLFETKESMPYISSSVQSHLISRAVLTKDMNLLKKSINDRKQISNVNPRRSLASAYQHRYSFLCQKGKISYDFYHFWHITEQIVNIYSLIAPIGPMNYAMMTANKKALDELNKIVNPPKNQKKMKIPPRVGSPRCHLKAGFLKNIKDNWEALFWGLCLFYVRSFS